MTLEPDGWLIDGVDGEHATTVSLYGNRKPGAEPLFAESTITETIDRIEEKSYPDAEDELGEEFDAGWRAALDQIKEEFKQKGGDAE